MSRLRARLGLVAIVWLSCQLTFLAATPASLWHAMHVATEDHVCCPGMAPGQYCPMHKHWNGSRTPQPAKSQSSQNSNDCALKSGCTPQAAGLEAFVGPATVPEKPCTRDSDTSSSLAVVCGTVNTLPIAPALPPPRA